MPGEFSRCISRYNIDRGTSSPYRDEACAMYKTCDLKNDHKPPMKLYISFMEGNISSDQPNLTI